MSEEDLQSKPEKRVYDPAGFDPSFERIPFLEKINYVADLVSLGGEQEAIDKQLEDLRILLNCAYMHGSSRMERLGGRGGIAVLMSADESESQSTDVNSDLIIVYPGLAFREESRLKGLQCKFVDCDNKLYLEVKPRIGNLILPERRYYDTRFITGIKFLPLK